MKPSRLATVSSTSGTSWPSEELNPTFYAAAGQPKTLWQVPGSSHTGGIKARPKEYERRVIGFFDQALATND